MPRSSTPRPAARGPQCAANFLRRGGLRAGSAHAYTDDSITYGMCNIGCELALAFRTLATVCVYFLVKQHRAELADVRTLFTRLWSRILGRIRPSQVNRVRFHRNSRLDSFRQIPRGALRQALCLGPRGVHGPPSHSLARALGGAESMLGDGEDDGGVVDVDLGGSRAPYHEFEDDDAPGESRM